MEKLNSKLINKIYNHIQLGIKLKQKDINSILDAYPELLFESKAYRYVGLAVEIKKYKPSLKKDICWTSNKKYQYERYLDSYDKFFMFESKIKGLNVKKLLYIIKNHKKIKEIYHFHKESEVIAISIIEPKLIKIIYSHWIPQEDRTNE